MNKQKERKVLDTLLENLEVWKLVKHGDKPDFVIKNIETNECVGVEVTTYYPHRNSKNQALVEMPGDDNKHRYFEALEEGVHFRFVAYFNPETFYNNTLNSKEEKLNTYKQNEPGCSEYWLLVKMPFYDAEFINDKNVCIKTNYDRIFIVEEPDSITEMNVSRLI